MSRHPLHHRLVLAITAFMTLAGCADEAGPGPSDGAYPLARLNDQPMPYDHEGLGCCTYLEGGLELAEGTYAISLAARNRNTSEVFALREWGKATARGPSLTFKPDSFEVIGFQLDVATLTGDSIRVAFGGEGPGSPDQFQALFVRAP